MTAVVTAPTTSHWAITQAAIDAAHGLGALVARVCAAVRDFFLWMWAALFGGGGAPPVPAPVVAQAVTEALTPSEVRGSSPPGSPRSAGTPAPREPSPIGNLSQNDLFVAGIAISLELEHKRVLDHGNCLFDSFACGLQALGIEKTHEQLRIEVVGYLRAHQGDEEMVGALQLGSVADYREKALRTIDEELQVKRLAEGELQERLANLEAVTGLEGDDLAEQQATLASLAEEIAVKQAECQTLEASKEQFSEELFGVDKYLELLQADGFYGAQAELLALTKLYPDIEVVNHCVHYADGVAQRTSQEKYNTGGSRGTIHLVYQNRNHYDALVPAST